MADARRTPVRDFFQANARAWRERYSRDDFDSINYRDRMAEALHWMERRLPAGARVLDAGCGAGEQAKALAARGHEVFACDIAPAMAALAGERLGGVVSIGSVELMPYARGSFDGALLLGVIGYSAAPERVLEELRGVLRPGGVLVISSAHTELLFDDWSQRASRVPQALYHRVTGRGLPQAEEAGFYRSHYHYMAAPRFDALLARHGFRRLAGSGVNFGRLRFMGKALWPEAVDVALTRGLTRASRRLPGLCAHARIYVGCYRRE